MSNNPYQPPVVADISPGDESLQARRNRALYLVRWTLVILLIPGAANFFCFHFVRASHRFYFNDGYIIHPFDQPLFAAINFIGCALLVSFVWFGGLKTLECVAVVTHHIVAENMPKQRWLESMYASMWPLKWVVPVGAVAWLCWLYFYFYSNMDVIVLDILLGGFGQILAFCVYGNIFYHWFALRREHRAEINREISI